jgi:hypothetical protein
MDRRPEMVDAVAIERQDDSGKPIATLGHADAVMTTLQSTLGLPGENSKIEDVIAATATALYAAADQVTLRVQNALAAGRSASLTLAPKGENHEN